MKLLWVFLIMGLVNIANAQALDFSANGPTEKEISDVRLQVDNLFMSMEGVNGISTTACEEKSGIPFGDLPRGDLDGKTFELCISVFTLTNEAADALKALFPQGSKYQNIYIDIDFTGPIVFQ